MEQRALMPHMYFLSTLDWLAGALSKTTCGWLDSVTGTNSLQQQATTTKKQLSLSCSRRKPLSVIDSAELAATGRVHAEWIMLVLCDSELKGYLCCSAP